MATEQRAGRGGGYTPGPWHVSGHDSETGTPATVSGADGEPICDLYRRNPDNDGNARLLLSAPKLVEALRELVERLQFEELGDGTYPDLTEARAVLAAIAGQP